MIPRLRSHWTGAAAIALLLAVAHTWPLATAPGTHSLNYNGDVMLNEWIIAWIQHQLPRDPLALFQANIFHPAPDVLAFSEPLIVPALLGAPVRILGGSPVLVHNLLLLAGLTLTMLATYALSYRWTRDPFASLVAGAAFTFNTQSLMRLEHLQAAHAYGLPLALVAADRLIETGSRRHAAWLALWMTAMVYSSGYLVVFASIALAVLLLARAGAWRRQPLRVIGGFALAALLTGLAALPVYLPYRRVAIEQGMVRTLDGVAQYSATLDGYVASYSRLHDWLWNAAAPRESPDAYFPGIVITLLALVAVSRTRQVWLPPAGGTVWLPPAGGIVAALLALAVTGCVVSLGTRTPVYGWLYAVFPPMSALRAAARFGVLFLLAAALLGGIGLAMIRARLPRRAAVAVGFSALLLVTVEAMRAPIAYTPFEGIPGIYTWLAREPEPVVLVEVPFYPPEAIFQNAEYVLNSTAHWRPLMNGYSGYTPATYREVAWPFWNFPAAASIDAMRAAGVTHVVVHPDRFEADGPEVLRQALANPHLERLAVSRGNTTLFRMR
jgi:hypothetical protein